jgi:hypothetical protein
MTAPVLSLTESQTLTALRSFLLAVLPAGVEVVRGLDNRVPEPAGANFVVMTPIMRERLETNVDRYDGLDIETLTFAALTNIPSLGDQVSNSGATASGIVSAISGLNVVVLPATGSYFAVGDTVTDTTAALPIGTVTAVSYGGKASLQPMKVTVQLDIHGPASADNAQIISTLFRDEYGVTQFSTSGFDVVPLYADDPKQLPYLNGEQQIEERWSIDAVMQTNPVVTTPMQFMDAISVNVISVEAVYPA